MNAGLIQDQWEALDEAYEFIAPRDGYQLMPGDVIVPPWVIRNAKRFEMFELKEDE